MSGAFCRWLGGSYFFTSELGSPFLCSSQVHPFCIPAVFAPVCPLSPYRGLQQQHVLPANPLPAARVMAYNTAVIISSLCHTPVLGILLCPNFSSTDA